MTLKIIPSLLLFSFFLFDSALMGQNTEYQTKVKQYIEKYKSEAIREMKHYKIPASITLAQGIIESSAGSSNLAINANNHFGIKCHKEWKGMTFIQDDETKNECFRKYGDPLESFRDHSMFLTTRDRYKSLFLLDITDYAGWANGLRSAGYATNPNYAGMLIKTIETFNLQQFDQLKEPVVNDTVVPVIPGNDTLNARDFKTTKKTSTGREIYVNNRLKLIIAKDDDNIYQIAMEFNISVEKLLNYNDLAFATSLKPGQIVYLESKRRKGACPTHILRNGETLYSISQQYGIKLKMLYKRNHFEHNPEPPPGTLLKLR